MDLFDAELALSLFWLLLPLLLGCGGWIVWYLMRDRREAHEAAPPAVEMTATELQALIDAEVEAARAPLEARLAALEGEPPTRPLDASAGVRGEAPAPAESARRRAR